jgi:hypothetical protein
VLLNPPNLPITSVVLPGMEVLSRPRLRAVFFLSGKFSSCHSTSLKAFQVLNGKIGQCWKRRSSSANVRGAMNPGETSPCSISKWDLDWLTEHGLPGDQNSTSLSGITLFRT